MRAFLANAIVRAESGVFDINPCVIAIDVVGAHARATKGRCNVAGERTIDSRARSLAGYHLARPRRRVRLRPRQTMEDTRQPPR